MEEPERQSNTPCQRSGVNGLAAANPLALAVRIKARMNITSQGG